MYLPPSNFVVTPVLAWWATPSNLSVVDRSEVARVLRAPLSELTDPARRFTVQHPSGFVGPAFDVDGLLVWGFTAGLISKVLELAGLTILVWAHRRFRLGEPARRRHFLRTGRLGRDLVG